MEKIIIDNYHLRKYLQEDKQEFIEIFMTEELCKYMSGGAFDEYQDAENLFESFINPLNTNKFHTKKYGIFLKNKLIGHFELNKNDFTNSDEIEIVYLLKKNYWGKGIMKTIIQHYNNSIKEKIVARVHLNNFNSIKMLKKIGIQKQTLTTFNNEKVIKFYLF